MRAVQLYFAAWFAGTISGCWSANQDFTPPPVKDHMGEPTTVSDADIAFGPFGPASRWTLYSPASVASPLVTSAKIIFNKQPLTDNPSYVMSLKRTKDKKADWLWELPGGRIDARESSLAALLRELTEEDVSGVLAQALRRAINDRDRPLYTQRVTLPNREQHDLFFSTLTQLEWDALLAHWTSAGQGKRHETGGYILLGQSSFDQRAPLHALLTPKTRKLLEVVAQP